jgi:hypothetical protein
MQSVQCPPYSLTKSFIIFNNLSNILGRSKRIGWARHIARMTEMAGFIRLRISASGGCIR